MAFPACVGDNEAAGRLERVVAVGVLVPGGGKGRREETLTTGGIWRRS